MSTTGTTALVEHVYDPNIDGDEEEKRTNNDEEDVFDETEVQVYMPNLPQDRYRMVYVGFYVLGTSILLPWFFFVTCNDYWMYKFRDIHGGSSEKSPLQASFTSLISMASTIPSSIYMCFNTFLTRRLSMKLRIFGPLILVLILFTYTTAFVLIDTDNWQIQYLYMTLISVCFMNVSAVMMSSALFGVVSVFPVTYIRAFVSGQSIGGIFSSIARIISISIGLSPVVSSMFYFLIADLFLAFSLACYIATTRSDFYKYYLSKLLNDVAPNDYGSTTDASTTNRVNRNLNYKHILKKIWMECATNFLCYSVTMSIYPSIAVLVVSSNMGIHSKWNEAYFIPVVTYLMYSICEYLGRIMAGVIPMGELRDTVRRCILWLSLIRITLIPLLMVCNAQPRHHLPVLIESDVGYALVTAALAVTNGFLSTATYLAVGTVVEAHEQEVAGSMLTTCLAFGLAVGSLISLPLIKLL